MSIKLTRRIAARLLKRGENAVRINESAHPDATKAITAEDVRGLIEKGSVYAVKKKRNLSIHGKELKIKRHKGRSRGPGRKKGTYKARIGRTYPKRIRAQRRIIKELKADGTINNEQFKKFYSLVKGGTFSNKAQLINHIMSKGVNIDSERYNKLKHV